mgnify:CR=1 FL=1
MKTTKILSLLMAIFFISSISSCDKCQECHCEYQWTNNVHIFEVCRDNFLSKKEYKEYIDNIEADSNYCECKADILW